LSKLYIKQEVFSLGGYFYVKDESGFDKYNVQGEFFSFGKKLHVYDSAGNEAAFIRQKIMSLIPRYVIKVHGSNIYEIEKEFTFFKPGFYLEGIDWRLDGDFWAHNYYLQEGANTIMEMKKHWFTWGDSYELDIYDPKDELLCLCIVLAVDCILFSGSSS
jgi:uncharacterized protein YxjI